MQAPYVSSTCSDAVRLMDPRLTQRRPLQGAERRRVQLDGSTRNSGETMNRLSVALGEVRCSRGDRHESVHASAAWSRRSRGPEP